MRQLLRLCRYLYIFTSSRQEWRVVHNRKSTDSFMTNLEDLKEQTSADSSYVISVYGVRGLSLFFAQRSLPKPVMKG